MKMNINRAQELLVPLKNGTANGISLEWSARLIEALEYVIEHEAAQPAGEATKPCAECQTWTYDNADGNCNVCGTRR